MREIKFRAWNIAERRMIYWRLFDYYQWHETPAQRLRPMQYTGLKDKNGIEIYEGDIIVRHGDKKIVEWIGGDEQDFQGFDIDNVFGKWEIIGNLYENPELLRKEE